MASVYSHLFESSVVIVEMITLYMFLSGIFMRNDRSEKAVLLAYSSMGFALAAASIFIPNMLLLATTTFAGVLILVLLLYASQTLPAIFAAFAYLLIVIAIDAIVPMMYSMLLDIELSSFRAFSELRVVVTLTTKLTLLLIVRIIVMLMEKRRLPLQRRMLQSIPLIICQFILIAAIVSIFIVNYETGETIPRAAVSVVIGLSAVDIVVIWYYKLLIDIYELRRANEIAAMQLDSQIKHFELVKSHQDTINAIEHDMKKHINAIEGMVLLNRAGEVSDYIKQFSGVISENMGLVSTPNPLISAILTHCMQRTKKDSVDTQIAVSVPSVVSISNIDLTVILSNTIDNAIEALDNMNIEDRKLSISLKQNEHYLFYEIANTYDAAAGKTERNGDSPRGYGLANVRSSVDKYGGTMNVKDDSNEFTVTIMIPCPAEQASTDA